MIWPLPYNDVYISSSFKLRTLNGVTRWHNGIDTCRWSGTQGADVIAVKDGVIESAGWNGGYGNLVVVNHGNGVLTYYAHLSGYNCSAGQSVSQGDVIGYAGNTGYSFGAHLHFGIMINGDWVDPVLYVTRYTPNGSYIQHTDADGH
jgi:murein DD-endopeptidase MepM/ murein hydrolase activator NlpD